MNSFDRVNTHTLNSEEVLPYSDSHLDVTEELEAHAVDEDEVLHFVDERFSNLTHKV